MCYYLNKKKNLNILEKIGHPYIINDENHGNLKKYSGKLRKNQRAFLLDFCSHPEKKKKKLSIFNELLLCTCLSMHYFWIFSRLQLLFLRNVDLVVPKSKVVSLCAFPLGTLTFVKTPRNFSMLLSDIRKTVVVSCIDRLREHIKSLNTLSRTPQIKYIYRLFTQQFPCSATFLHG